MKKIILLVLGFLVVIGFIIWHKYSSYVTFEATIEDIVEYNGNHSFFVKGLETNDINYTGEYSFVVKESIKLVSDGKKIEIENFEEGDKIAITFDGIMLTSYPAQIPNIYKIELLK